MDVVKVLAVSLAFFYKLNLVALIDITGGDAAEDGGWIGRGGSINHTSPTASKLQF